MAAKDIKKFQYKKGQSGNPNGRPPNRVPEQLVKIFGSKQRAKDFYNLNGEEIDSWEKAILSMTTPQLSLLAKWEETPIYPRGLAISIITDMKNGATKTLDKLRDRQYGATRKSIDVTTNGKDIAKIQSDPLQLHIVTSTDEYKKILEEINKEREHKNADFGEIED